MYSDLECDYINPIDLCSKLNAVRSYQSYLALRSLIMIIVHVTRSGRTRNIYYSFSTLGAVVGAFIKSAIGGVQH